MEIYRVTKPSPTGEGGGGGWFSIWPTLYKMFFFGNLIPKQFGERREN